VFEKRGWAQVLPDPDEPLVHVYAEGKTPADGESLEAEFLALVEEVVGADGEGATDEEL
jgi:phosphomannomutase